MSDNAFVGVDPIYQNYADVTGKPFFSGDKDERKLEEAQQESAKAAEIELNDRGMPVYDAPIGGPRKEEAEAESAPTLTEQVLEILEAKEKHEASKTDAAPAPAKAAAPKASTAKAAAAETEKK
ncbi:hypothetical protein SEA_TROGGLEHUMPER_36 [Rhodococcus phage Trogglehumper]|uniref:Uncharacterized protein n=1 Tax=Rhodococcus phage Trogglehumper TaxID=3038381 RepID=A0AAF0GJ32_9CAUD|nr:hypothetical protein SEA_TROGGLEHUMPER_36 [Rhodococcus phage Trogglehumper]